MFVGLNMIVRLHPYVSAYELDTIGAKPYTKLFKILTNPEATFEVADSFPTRGINKKPYCVLKNPYKDGTYIWIYSHMVVSVD